MNNSSSNSYNGWSNRATWNIVLWLSNTEHDYDRVVRAFGKKPATDQSAEMFCRAVFGSETPDRCKLNEADWCEVRKGINELVGHEEDQS